jgi:hypothetical protein
LTKKHLSFLLVEQFERLNTYKFCVEYFLLQYQMSLKRRPPTTPTSSPAESLLRNFPTTTTHLPESLAQYRSEYPTVQIHDGITYTCLLKKTRPQDALPTWILLIGERHSIVCNTNASLVSRKLADICKPHDHFFLEQNVDLLPSSNTKMDERFGEINVDETIHVGDRVKYSPGYRTGIIISHPMKHMPGSRVTVTGLQTKSAHKYNGLHGKVYRKTPAGRYTVYIGQVPLNIREENILPRDSMSYEVHFETDENSSYIEMKPRMLIKTKGKNLTGVVTQVYKNGEVHIQRPTGGLRRIVLQQGDQIQVPHVREPAIVTRINGNNTYDLRLIHASNSYVSAAHENAILKQKEDHFRIGDFVAHRQSRGHVTRLFSQSATIFNPKTREEKTVLVTDLDPPPKRPCRSGTRSCIVACRNGMSARSFLSMRRS